MVKSILDYGIAVAALILLFPLFVLLGILVKLDSPGPIFYRRRVLAKHGVPFDAFKFRTMVAHDKAGPGPPVQIRGPMNSGRKAENGGRMTRVGRRLRSYSLGMSFRNSTSSWDR